MTEITISLSLGILAFVLHVFLSIIAMRLFDQFNPIMTQFFSLFFSETVFIVVGSSIKQTVPFWEGSITLGFGAVVFLFFFSAVYKSVSLRILLRLYYAPYPTPHVDTIALNVARELVINRISVLLEMDYVLKKNDTYEITEKGRNFILRVLYIQRIFGVKSGGFYS